MEENFEIDPTISITKFACTTAEICSILKQLGSIHHMQREKAAGNWLKLKEKLSPEVIKPESEELRKRLMLMLKSERWEDRYGALFVISDLLLEIESIEFKADVIELLKSLMKDPEFRVRIAVGNTLGSLVKKDGVKLYEYFKDSIEHIIETSLELKEEIKADMMVENIEGEFELSGSPRNSYIGKDYKKEGWGNLETTMRVIQKIVEHSDVSFLPYLDEKLLNAIEKAVNHPNRHVRESALSLSSSLLAISDTKNFQAIGLRIVPLIQQCLSDIWPQVRYAGCVATKTLLFTKKLLPDFQKHCYSKILPAICINRYYVAEGIRNSAMDIWKSVVGEKGREYVAEYIESFVGYYITQTKSESYLVRESACHCIGEIFAKVSVIAKEKVMEHIVTLLEVLIEKMDDFCWPVKNAACAASGKLVLEFPKEVMAKREHLMELWFKYLTDNFSAVRENSAAALASAAKVYGKEVLDKVIAKLDELLPMAKNQPSEAESPHEVESYPFLPKGAHIKNVINLTDLVKETKPIKQEVKSSRITEPWECSDGAIHLLNELSTVCPKEIVRHMPILAELANLNHFHDAICLKETIYSYLPGVMKNIGKSQCKASLELFFDGIFAMFKGKKVFAAETARDCLQELGKFVGPSIMKGRLAAYRQEYADEYEAILKSVPFTK